MSYMPLHDACREGQVEVAMALIDQGADVNAIDHFPLISFSSNPTNRNCQSEKASIWTHFLRGEVLKEVLVRFGYYKNSYEICI